METIKELFEYYKKLSYKQKFKFLFVAPIAMVSAFLATVSDICNDVVHTVNGKVQDILEKFIGI